MKIVALKWVIYVSLPISRYKRFFHKKHNKSIQTNICERRSLIYPLTLIPLLSHYFWVFNWNLSPLLPSRRVRNLISWFTTYLIFQLLNSAARYWYFRKSSYPNLKLLIKRDLLLDVLNVHRHGCWQQSLFLLRSKLVNSHDIC